jgi:hypothetical protein
MNPLPHWPEGTAAVLCTTGPHAIPVSTPTRADDRRLLFALGPRREALRRIREDPRAALCVLAPGVAFTAHGLVTVLREEMEDVPITALELRAERVQDHLADGRTAIDAGPAWHWTEERAAEADRSVRAELRRLVRTD